MPAEQPPPSIKDLPPSIKDLLVTPPPAALPPGAPDAFAQCVAIELHAAQAQWGRMSDLADACGILAEELDEFWEECRKPAPQRSAQRLLVELIQIAAMCQRAVDDLALLRAVLGAPLTVRFGAYTDEAYRDWRRRARPMRTCHGAHTHLRAALEHVTAALRHTGRPAEVLALLALAELYARCQAATEDLDLLARAFTRRASRHVPAALPPVPSPTEHPGT